MIMDSKYKIGYVEQEGKVYSNLRNFHVFLYTCRFDILVPQ
jgi:hypothetical protein